LEFRQVPSVIKSSELTLDSTNLFTTFSFSLRGFEDSVQLRVAPATPLGWTAFLTGGHQCSWVLSDQSGATLAQLYGGNGTVLKLDAFPMPNAGDAGTSEAARHAVRNIAVTCTLFENTGAAIPKDFRLRFFAETIATDDPLLRGWSSQAGSIPASLKPGLNEIRLPTLLIDHLRAKGYPSIEVMLRGPIQVPVTAAPLGVVQVTGQTM
jgi:hypothetical protein